MTARIPPATPPFEPDIAAKPPQNAILEMLMLAGFYRTVSYLTNALRLPLERAGTRFPEQAVRR